jgi:hypothetical protein
MFPSITTVERAINATFFLGCMCVPQGRYVDNVRVPRMDYDAAHPASRIKAHMLPVLSSICRFVDTISYCDV